MIDPRTLAEGARLLHIGFRKSGSTALQAALQRARLPLAALGVVYPGSNGNHTPAALAVTGRTHGWASRGARPQPMHKWNALVEEVAAIPPTQRAVISSEFFDVADEATIQTVAAGLGAERFHVVVTARPLARVLSSAWQQQVRVGNRSSYGTWLRQVLEPNDQSQTHRTFWERHDQAAVLSRWAGAVGPERVTLIVLDEHDRALPYRSFETMLGVPHGTLEERPDRGNRSLTGPEVELIRRVNMEVFERDITWDEYRRWISRGAALRMVTERMPGPDEPRLHTPQWALQQATEISTGFVDRIATLGVEVIGDLQTLVAPPTPAGPDMAEPDPELLPIDAAVHAVLGSGFSNRDRPASEPTAPPPAASSPAPGEPSVGELSTRELACVLAARIRRRARRSWRRTRRRRSAAE